MLHPNNNLRTLMSNYSWDGPQTENDRVGGGACTAACNVRAWLCRVGTFPQEVVQLRVGHCLGQVELARGRRPRTCSCPRLAHVRALVHGELARGGLLVEAEVARGSRRAADAAAAAPSSSSKGAST